MKNRTKKMLGFFMAVAMMATLAGCADKAEETPPVTTPHVSITPTPTPAPPKKEEPQFLNPLTGLEIKEELVGKRPVAVMINNLITALPQVGISSADIIYECTVEGGITRLMAVTTDYASLDVIGSVRSSRDYFIDFAQNHDAIYAHAGGSPDAYSAIKSRKIDNMDGVNQNIPGMFYRDAARKKKMGLEHSMMTSGDGIVKGIAFRKLRTDVKEGFASPFVFAKEGYVPNGAVAGRIVAPYSKSVSATFDYDSEKKAYLKSEYGKAHIDGATGTQMQFENVLVLRAKHSNTGDEKGRITVDFTGEGSGYYAFGGKSMEIKWSKANRDKPMKLTTADGKQLELNRGKTYISVVPTDSQVIVE